MSFKFSAKPRNRLSEIVISGRPVVCGDGYKISGKNESIPGTLEWQEKDNRVLLVLHLGGAIREIESEFDGRGVKLDPPMSGEIWLVPAGVKYATRVKGVSASYIEMLIGPAVNGGAASKGMGRLTPVAGGFDRPLAEMVIELYGLNDEQDELSAVRRNEIVFDIIDRITEKFSLEPTPKTLRNVRFSPETRAALEAFILEHLSEQITLERLCSITDETPHRFLWAFRNAFGSTPAQHMLSQRVRRARHLLGSTKKDITTIAMETGFADHSHLSTAFKRRTGLSPSQYRSLA